MKNKKEKLKFPLVYKTMAKMTRIQFLPKTIMNNPGTNSQVGLLSVRCSILRNKLNLYDIIMIQIPGAALCVF